jgi:hypothetical protein
MVSLRRVSGLGLVTWMLTSGCGADAQHKKPEISDAAPDAGSGGTSYTGGKPSSGGAATSGGTTASGGLAATGGTPGSGGTRAVDASVDGSTEADGALDGSPRGLVCTSDGGKDGGKEWRDFAANACRACPASPPGCGDFTSFTFDPGTSILTAVVGAGLDELVSAEFNATYTATTDGGYAYGQVNANAVVRGNTLTVDLSKVLPSRTVEINGATFDVKDACGQTVIGDACLVMALRSDTTDAGSWVGFCYNDCG